MRRVFSGFLAGFDEKRELQDLGLWQPMWQGLCRELRRELQRRRLWELSPSILGVVGMARWQVKPTGGSLRGRSLEALDELATGAYQFVFMDRFDSLRRHLEVKGEIEGLVRLNVRNYIYETQRRHDPLGTRVFGIVKSGVALALERRTLFVLAGGPKVSNDTLLGTRPDAAVEPGVEERLVELTRDWNDDLLARMMTADGKNRAELLADLAGRLAGLGDQGIRAFTFGGLITPLKTDARRRWAAILGADARHRGEVVGLEEYQALGVVPSQRLEDRDRFAKLSRCVEQRLVNLPGQRRTRNHRLHLWRYLHRFSWEVDEFPEELPSHRELARILGIPRERFNELYDTIREELRRCLGAMQTSPAWPRQTSVAAEGTRMEPAEQRDRLLAETARKAAPGEARPPEIVSSSREGQIHTLAETSAEGIEWLVLEVDPWSGTRVVPVDTSPMVGSRDLEIFSPGAGPLVFRLDLARWIPSHCLQRETGFLQMTAEDFERVLVARARLAARRVEPSLLDEEIELDPEYQAWREEVRAAGQRLAEGEPAIEPRGAREMPEPEAPRLARRWRQPLAIAAALALFSLGGWFSSLFQRDSVSDLYRRQAEELASLAQAAATASAAEDRSEILRSVPSLRFQTLVPALVTRGAGGEGSRKVALADASQLYLFLLSDSEKGDRLALFPFDSGEKAEPLGVFPVDWAEDGALVAIPSSLLAGGDEFRLQLSSSRDGKVLETYHLKTGP